MILRAVSLNLLRPASPGKGYEVTRRPEGGQRVGALPWLDALSHPSPILIPGRIRRPAFHLAEDPVQRTHSAAPGAALTGAPVLRPGPTRRASPAPPPPIRPRFWGLRVAGRVDGAGMVRRLER
jgi:hypothetical protein